MIAEELSRSGLIAKVTRKLARQDILAQHYSPSRWSPCVSRFEQTTAAGLAKVLTKFDLLLDAHICMIRGIARVDRSIFGLFWDHDVPFDKNGEVNGHYIIEVTASTRLALTSLYEVMACFPALLPVQLLRSACSGSSPPSLRTCGRSAALATHVYPVSSDLVSLKAPTGSACCDKPHRFSGAVAGSPFQETGVLAGLPDPICARGVVSAPAFSLTFTRMSQSLRYATV